MGTRIPALLEHAQAAAAYATERICRGHPDYLARFGEQRRCLCEADIASHLVHIDSAIETGSSIPLGEYLRWLREVLISREVPGETLVESMHLLGEYFEERLPSDQGDLLRRVLADGVEALQAAAPVEPAYMKWLPQPLPEAESLACSLTRGDVTMVRSTVHGFQAAGTSYLDLAVRLFQPALYRVGELWQKNRISVAQEHLATALVQNHLALAFSVARCAPPADRRALFACVEGDLHAVGLRMVSDAFELAGWEVQYLGGSLPQASLLSQVDACRPDLVGLSASLVQHIPALKDTVGALRGEFGAGCPAIMVGGLANNQVAGFWKAAGADLWAPSADLAIQAIAP